MSKPPATRRIVLCLMFLGGAAAAQDPAPDVGAQVFSQKCIGCHTIGGGMLAGPDLLGMIERPRADVETAVERMSKSVGPMTPEEVQVLTDLLMAEDAAARVQGEQERAILTATAALEPADAAAGKALFHGARPFASGAVACAACHRAEGRGGNLAVPLEDSFARLGHASLASVCEQPAFPAMRAAYAKKPVSKQETLHLVKYLESLPAEPAPAGAVPVGWAGSLLAVGALAGVGFAYRRRPGGTVRRRLIQETTAGTRRGRIAQGRKA